jgi:hypothetical protein
MHPHNLGFSGTLSGDTLTGQMTRTGSLFCSEISGPSSGVGAPSHIHFYVPVIAGGRGLLGQQCPGVPSSSIDLAR